MAFIVAANTPFTITVNDNTGRILAEQGFMGNYTSGAYGPSVNTTLASPLGLTGTTNSTTSAEVITPPIRTASPQTLYTGTSAVSNQYLFNTFSQAVAFGDPLLPTGSEYRVDLQFTISST